MYSAASDYVKSQQAGEGADGEEKPPPQQQGPAVPCNIAFAFALGLESGGLVDLLQQTTTTRCHSFTEHLGRLGEQVVLAVETGEGEQKTTQAITGLLTMYDPFWLVSCGFAEALAPDLKRGDIVMASRVVDEEGNDFETGLHIDPVQIAQTPNLHLGTLLNVSTPYRTPDQRLELGQRFNSLACDTESMALARLCADREIRFLAVKIITDAQADQPPPEVASYLSQQSLAGKMGAAAGTLFRKPSAFKSMFQLRQNAMKASDRLAKFLASMSQQL